MNFVRSWLSSSSGHWWYPLSASSLVNTLAFSAAMSATVWAGVSDRYLSQTCSGGISRRTFWSCPCLLGATTMGEHHSVGSVTGAMTPWSCRWSSSALSLSQKANGTVLGVLTQNGLASLVKVMWNLSLFMVLICPSKAVGYSSWMSRGALVCH